MDGLPADPLHLSALPYIERAQVTSWGGVERNRRRSAIRTETKVGAGGTSSIEDLWARISRGEGIVADA